MQMHEASLSTLQLGHCHSLICTRIVKKIASQVDLLINERKEAQAAAKSDESSKRQKEADDNAYLSLMPLALPAPTPPTSDFAGPLPHPCQFINSQLFDLIPQDE